MSYPRHMLNTSTMRGPARRWLFAGWIALTVVIATYTAISGPLVPMVEAQYRWVAAVVPPVMILLTLGGVGWLALYEFAGARRDRI